MHLNENIDNKVNDRMMNLKTNAHTLTNEMKIKLISFNLKNALFFCQKEQNLNRFHKSAFKCVIMLI